MPGAGFQNLCFDVGIRTIYDNGNHAWFTRQLSNKL
jgi:hypothetical protein